MKAPKISVVIPLYDDAVNIARAITSVVNQQITVHEIIVVAGEINKDTLNTIHALNVDNLRLIRQRCGAASARRVGIEEATGEFVAFLDAGNEWMPLFTTEMLSLHSRYPEAIAYASRYQKVVANEGFVDPNVYLCNWNTEGYLLDYFSVARRGELPFTTSTLMVRKRQFVTATEVPTEDGVGEEHAFFVQLALNGQIAYSPMMMALIHISGTRLDATATLPLKEHPFVKHLHEKIRAGAIHESMVDDAMKYIAGHLCYQARLNCERQYYGHALSLLQDERCNLRPLHKVAYTLWATAGLFRQRVLSLSSSQTI